LRITYDSEANATYIYLMEGSQIARTETVHDEECFINLDKDIEGNVIGVEIVASKGE
jgi:uncharacterized protein YuzE